MQRYAFFPNCNKNMQNINHFLIFSNTYNPKHTPPPPKKKNPPQQNPLKKNPSAPSAPSAPKNPPPQNPPQKNPSAPSCSECSQKPLHPKKAKKRLPPAKRAAIIISNNYCL